MVFTMACGHSQEATAGDGVEAAFFFFFLHCSEYIFALDLRVEIISHFVCEEPFVYGPISISTFTATGVGEGGAWVGEDIEV